VPYFWVHGPVWVSWVSFSGTAVHLLLDHGLWLPAVSRARAEKQ
jgi:hypothetical protein